MRIARERVRLVLSEDDEPCFLELAKYEQEVDSNQRKYALNAPQTNYNGWRPSGCRRAYKKQMADESYLDLVYYNRGVNMARMGRQALPSEMPQFWRTTKDTTKNFT